MYFYKYRERQTDRHTPVKPVHSVTLMTASRPRKLQLECYLIFAFWNPKVEGKGRIHSGRFHRIPAVVLGRCQGPSPIAHHSLLTHSSLVT